MKKETKKVHLMNFHIAGFSYWDGCEAFENLKIGTKLQLEREEDNKFDPTNTPGAAFSVGSSALTRTTGCCCRTISARI